MGDLSLGLALLELRAAGQERERGPCEDELEVECERRRPRADAEAVPALAEGVVLAQHHRGPVSGRHGGQGQLHAHRHVPWEGRARGKSEEGGGGRRP